MSHHHVLLFVLVNLVVFSLENPLLEDDPPACGYAACQQYSGDDVINVHVVPHSHDDVGWLKTVDQYYDDDVSQILTAVTEELLKNPERRFIQVETAFFKKWWLQQSDETKEQVKGLVNRGQLEFTGGAWSMNDEAAFHYQSVVDQFTLGFRFLEDEFGECAKVHAGWQIDPFGHSREHASISARLGFDSLHFARIDYRDKGTRLAAKTADLMWRASQSLDSPSADIFTHVFSGHYSSPGTFCFDAVCDDAEITDGNQEARVQQFTNFVRDQVGKFATNNILVPFGDDFRYKNASKNFRNLDLLIDGFRKFPQTVAGDGRPINLFYSTPACYGKFVNQYDQENSNFELPVKTDDFFPYADSPNTYWTGYFTSRPASKRFERIGNNALQVAKQLSALTGGAYGVDRVQQLSEAMGVLQHHDAITGTEKQNVTNNYHLLLAAGIQSSVEHSGALLSMLAQTDLLPETCLLANISLCAPSAGEQFTVLVYNPLGRPVDSVVSVPVSFDADWVVQDVARDTELAVQVTAPIRDFSFVEDGDTKVSPFILEFTAGQIPALGHCIFRVSHREKKQDTVRNAGNPRKEYGYEDANFKIDEQTGLLTHVTMGDVTIDISQDWLYYSNQNTSGAYIFVPYEGAPKRVAESSVVVTPLPENDLYQGVLQQFSPWAQQTIKIYENDRTFVEFDWVIGPVDFDSDGVGREIVSRFSTYLKSAGVFYTDSNGRELVKRTRNHREDYEYSNEQPVAGNYYPVNTRILMRDESADVEVAILTDRSAGGSSLADGELEVMVHRICEHDDSRGVGENLNEIQWGQGIVVRGKHRLVIGKSSDAAKTGRRIAQETQLAPWVFIFDTAADGITFDNSAWYGLGSNLPDNVHLLTLEPWGDSVVLLRLEHLFGKDEHEELSKEVTVNVTDLFSTFTITKLEETTLGGNTALTSKHAERLKWTTTSSSSSSKNIEERRRELEDGQVTLSPMEIRTFWATVESTF